MIVLVYFIAVNIARVVSTNLYIIFLQLKKEANTVSNTSLLCRINRRHQIISLKTRICRSGSKGLRSDCICICGLLWLSCDLWWWFIVNCDDGLLCLWHTIMPVTYNYACDDALLWIMMVYCELRGVRYTWQISKKGGSWSLCQV